jgi:hypothetical protein
VEAKIECKKVTQALVQVLVFVAPVLFFELRSLLFFVRTRWANASQMGQAQNLMAEKYYIESITAASFFTFWMLVFGILDLRGIVLSWPIVFWVSFLIILAQIMLLVGQFFSGSKKHNEQKKVLALVALRFVQLLTFLIFFLVR